MMTKWRCKSLSHHDEIGHWGPPQKQWGLSLPAKHASLSSLCFALYASGWTPTTWLSPECSRRIYIVGAWRLMWVISIYYIEWLVLWNSLCYSKYDMQLKELLEAYVHSSVLYHSWDLETAPVPISRWVCENTGDISPREYYAAVKVKHLLPCETACSHQEIIVLSKISESEKDNISWNHLYVKSNAQNKLSNKIEPLTCKRGGETDESQRERDIHSSCKRIHKYRVSPPNVFTL